MMLSDAVSEVMRGQMIKDVTSCSGMYANTLGCGMCNDAWLDDNRYYQLQWDVYDADRCSK